MAETRDSKSSTSKRPPVEADARSVLVPIGRVTGVHGLKGWVRMQVFADGGEVMRAGVALHVTPPEGPARVCGLRQVTAGRRGGEFRVALEGVGDRDAAQALLGSGVAVSAEVLGPAGEGQVWGHELIGCELEAEDGTPIGRVREIWATGAPDVLVVEAGGGREHLVPAALLVDVDLEARRAVVEVLPGLLETE